MNTQSIRPTAISRFVLVLLLLAVVGILATVQGQQPTGKNAKPKKGELVHAVIRGDEDAVRDLLRRGADVNENLGSQDAPITPLFAAIGRDYDKIARILIAHSHDLDLQRPYHGWTAKDFAIFFEQDTVAKGIAAEESVSQQEEKATLDIDQTTWVANGLAMLSKKKDHGTALGLSYIAAAYRQPGGDEIDRDGVLKQAQRLRNEYQKHLAAETTSNPTVAQVAAISFQVLEDKKMAQQVAQEAVRGSSNFIETSPNTSPMGVTLSAMQNGLAEKRFHEKVLLAAYRLGKNDPKNAGWVVNEFSGKTLNAKLTDKANAIVNRNQAHFHPAVITFVHSDAAQRKQNLNKAWGKFFQDIRKANAASIELLKRSDQAEYKAAKTKELQNTFAALDSSLYVLTTVASFENPKVAKQIHGIGSGAIQIGQSVTTCVVGGALTAASCCTVVGGIVAGTMAIISAFDNGPTTDKLILQQIAELRQQVEDVRLQMHERFDGVDRRMTQMAELMKHGFQSISIDLALAREELRTFAIQVSLIESNLYDLEPNVRSYLEVGFDRKLWEDVDRCMNWHKHEKTRLPYSKFSDTLSRLRYAGTVAAKDLLAVGRTLTKEELEDDAKLGARFLTLSKDGLDSNIGMMQAIARRFGHNGAFTRSRLANPMRWAMMVEAYVQLASQYPDYYFKQTTPAGVDEMMQVGEEWREAVRSLKAAKIGEDPKNTSTLYLRLLDNYKAKAGFLRHVIQDRVQKYQIENVEGYDLWAGVQQTIRGGLKRPAFGITEIPVSEDFDFSKAEPTELSHWKGGRHLSAPSVLSGPDRAKAVIDIPLLIAHHLGTGEIRVRWSAPNWDNQRRASLNMSTEHLYGKAALTVAALFKSNDGKDHLLFSNRLNSGVEFHYGIQTFHFKVVQREEGTGFQRRFVDHLVRDRPNWGHGNRMIDPRQEVLLQSEIQRHWSGMRDRMFQGIDRIPAPSVQVAAQLVDAHFKSHREALERELWAGVKGADGKLIDAMRQLSAAKAMLDAYVSLGMAKSLSEQTELRDLLAGEKMTKGQTRLLDGAMIEAIAAKKCGTLLELTRDVEWLDAPAKKLEAYFKSMPPTAEGQPLIETTMDRLVLLKKMHESAQPKQSRERAARELKKQVQALGQQ